IEKYSLNNRKVKNPRYTGINKKEAKDDDEEGSQKEEVKPTEEKKEEKDADTQIVATDSNGNEIQVVEKDNTKEETIEETTQEKDTSQISALILNKDSLLAILENEKDKLNDNLVRTIEELATNLDTYNQEKITDQELKDLTKAIVDRT